MKRILVPVDFSDHTVNTCKYALEIAKKYGSEITLFHAYNDQLFVSSPSMPDAYDVNPYSNAELAEDIKNDVQVMINKLSDELMNILTNENVKNVSIKTHISEGDLEFDLKQFCDEYHPSIIVIGSRGNGNSSNGGSSGNNYIIYLYNGVAFKGANSNGGVAGAASGMTSVCFTSFNNGGYGTGGYYGNGNSGAVFINY